MRTRTKMLWARALRAFGILALARTWVRRQGILVLTFHRVLQDHELQQTGSLPGMIVREKTFDGFLQYAAAHFETVDLDRNPTWQRGSRLKLAITFDDGWADNALHAFPIAHKHGALLTIFIVPERAGQTLPFWPERVALSILRASRASGQAVDVSDVEDEIERLKVFSPAQRLQQTPELAAVAEGDEQGPRMDRTMSWDQIRLLRDGGVKFGSHTCTHEILTTIPLDRARYEIAESRSIIEHHLSSQCRLFSYPNGNFSAELREEVARAGYKLAFLNQGAGVWTSDCDPLQIPRVNVSENHLVDSNGRFSPLAFEYTVIWRAAWGRLKQIVRTGRHQVFYPSARSMS